MTLKANEVFPKFKLEVRVFLAVTNPNLVITLLKNDVVKPNM